MVSELELFSLLKGKLGEKEARILTEYIEEKVRTNKEGYATNIRLQEMEASLKLAIAESKMDTIKWVAALLMAQAAIVATLVKLL